tara:strand:+ start:2354 stop:4141 length:1788 start_codon:yes stop_codon:yes gene_type:complete
MSEEYEDWGIEATAAEYKGRKVTLNKPFRTKGGAKKFAVYVKNSNGNVVIVRFGDPNMEIKRDDPKRRKAFRDRHNCAEKKDKTTAGYWSCKMWSSTPVNKMSSEFNKTDDTVSADMGDCGCGCTGHEAKDEDDPCTEGYEQYGMKTKNGREVPNCVPISKEAAEPSPKDDETHGEYMSRCQEAGYSEEECMAAHEGHDFKENLEGYKKDEEKEASYHNDGGSCKEGYERQGSMCVRVAVTCSIEIDDINTVVEASTGRSYIRISGIAFHDGINKNNWAIAPELASTLANRMIGADVTLNHPKSEMGRFTRNMEGGVDEAVVGTVTETMYIAKPDGYVVRYVAEVHRPELFEALESGLWMKPEYGVSIGGTGIPSEIIESDEEGGRPTMWFADDFQFDHLAIVHKPAYQEANIESAVKVEANETFMYQPDGSTDYSKVNKMTEEQINETESIVASEEMEALKADLVLKEAKIAEFEASEVARAEDARVALVSKASELGLKGHDEFSSEILTSMIASWESSQPAPVVEMTPAEPASTPAVASEPVSEPMVAGYFNRQETQIPKSLYARCYNSWVNAYNGVMTGADESRAKLYEELN